MKCILKDNHWCSNDCSYSGRKQFECDVCKQKHDRQTRADNCKHKQWCESCDLLYTHLQNHMMLTHGGWPCLKGCNRVYKGQDGKRRQDNCTCVEDKKALEKRNGRKKMKRKGMAKSRAERTQKEQTRDKIADKERKIKSREKRTPEEKTRDRIADNERKKRGRKPLAKLLPIYPCKRCWKFFKRRYHANKYVCHAVFFIHVNFVSYSAGWLLS